MAIFGLLQFPGSDYDAFKAITHVLQAQTRVFTAEDFCVRDVDCLVLPGGKAYFGASEADVKAVKTRLQEALLAYSAEGGLILGVGYGFQLLLETGLLPGEYVVAQDALMHCQDVFVRIEKSDTPFTCEIQSKSVLRLPIAHRLGRYELQSEEWERIERNDCIVMRYCNSRGEADAKSGPDGSVRNIAGIINENRNVMGMMVRPERYVDEMLGGIDGLGIFSSIIKHIGC